MIPCSSRCFVRIHSTCLTKLRPCLRASLRSNARSRIGRRTDVGKTVDKITSGLDVRAGTPWWRIVGGRRARSPGSRLPDVGDQGARRDVVELTTLLVSRGIGFLHAMDDGGEESESDMIVGYGRRELRLDGIGRRTGQAHAHDEGLRLDLALVDVAQDADEGVARGPVLGMVGLIRADFSDGGGMACEVVGHGRHSKGFPARTKSASRTHDHLTRASGCTIEMSASRNPIGVAFLILVLSLPPTMAIIPMRLAFA